MDDLDFGAWAATVHSRMKREPLWKSVAYQKALFLHECVWRDCEILQADVRGRSIVQQLIRSAGSISANLEEGHGRGYGKQRNWFWTVAIGSARESKGWYWRARHLLSEAVLDDRLSLADEIIAMLVSELSRHQHQDVR